MPTQKTFKRRVRDRMTKTGEAYTAARHQLLAKSGAPAAEPEPAPLEPEPAPQDLLVSEDAMVRGSGRDHAAWFAILDAWRASERRHGEIAAWLQEAHGVGGWWAQAITVDYERARGMRSRHQMGDGFSVSASKTIAADGATLLAAFTDEAIRRRWLAGASMTPRPTRAAWTARFDWHDPTSRVVVTVDPKGPAKATVSVQHEKLPDAATADAHKVAWRGWLGRLKGEIEGGAG
jgi:hypothetical protein